jgi:hypothetical protein
MPTHIPRGFSRRATRRPVKSARPLGIGTNQFGGWRSASLWGSPDVPVFHGASRGDPRLAGPSSPEPTALRQSGRVLL